MEASFFRREKVLEYPGRRDLMDDIKLVPEKFVVEENLNFDKEMAVDEGVTEDNKKITTSKVPSPAADELPTEAIRRRPLTFDPTPQREEDEDMMLAANDDQTELMQWHYCLAHLPFSKLKQLALNGQIPKKLAPRSSHPSTLAVSLTQ